MKRIILFVTITGFIFGCHKDQDAPEPNDINSCRIISFRNGYFKYDPSGRLEKDATYCYKYDNNGYLIERSRNYDLYPLNKEDIDITKYEYENGRLLKTTYLNYFAGSNDFGGTSTIRIFEYNSLDELIKVTENISKNSNSEHISTTKYELKNSKFVSCIEIKNNTMNQPYVFKDGKVVKYTYDRGYELYEYDELSRLIRVDYHLIGSYSLRKTSYDIGKSFFTTIPKFKGHPAVLDNWKQALISIPYNDLFDAEYLIKNISYFKIRNGSEIEQSRLSMSYQLNKRNLPEIISLGNFVIDDDGLLGDYKLQEDIILRYENCE